MGALENEMAGKERKWDHPRNFRRETAQLRVCQRWGSYVILAIQTS